MNDSTKNYLIGEKSELTFLAVQRRSVVNHFRMNFHLKKQTLIYIFKFDFFGFNLNTCQGIKRRKSWLKGFPCNGNPVLCLHILMAFSDDSLLVPENYLVNPLHVVSQLLQVFDVTITNFADDESTLALAVRLSGLQGLRRLRC